MSEQEKQARPIAYAIVHEIGTKDAIGWLEFIARYIPGVHAYVDPSNDEIVYATGPEDILDALYDLAEVFEIRYTQDIISKLPFRISVRYDEREAIDDLSFSWEILGILNEARNEKV